MKPTILYLFIFSLLALFIFVSAFESDSELLHNEDFDPEMTAFNEKLDKAADDIQEKLNVAVEELRAKKKEKNLVINQNPKHKLYLKTVDDVTQEEVDRLRRTISAKYFRDYGNFGTLNDGTFFGGMFTPDYQVASSDQEI